MNSRSSECKRAVGAWQTRLVCAVGAPRSQERGRNNRARAEARFKTIHDVRQALTAQRRRVQQVELALARWAEPRGRQTDQADRARDRIAFEECQGAAIELEALLGRLPGGAARMCLERREAELERHAAGGERALSELRGDAFGVGAQRRLELLQVRAVDAVRFLGADRLGHPVGLDRPVVAPEGQVVERLAVLSEAPRQDLARRLLELTDSREAQLAERLCHDLAHAPETIDR